MAKIALFAQPYDTTAEGFYFSSVSEYQDKAWRTINGYGDLVQEFELQFIDGEEIDCALAQAWKPSLMTLADFFEAVGEWDTERKRHYIIAVEECGYRHADAWKMPETIEIDLYEVENLRELAEQFVEEGLYGDIPENLQFYIDYDAIARDLAIDFTETEIARERIVYASR